MWTKVCVVYFYWTELITETIAGKNNLGRYFTIIAISSEYIHVGARTDFSAISELRERAHLNTNRYHCKANIILAKQ